MEAACEVDKDMVMDRNSWKIKIRIADPMCGTKVKIKEIKFN